MTLLEKLEAATGPDRKLDAEIAALVGWVKRTNEEGAEYWEPPDGLELPDIVERACIIRRMSTYTPKLDCPEFTASIDAAMTLTGDDFYLELKGPRKYLNIPTHSPNYWSAIVSKWNHENEGSGWGATPALAICIAAIKARGEG